jgi:zinc transporter 5/7
MAMEGVVGFSSPHFWELCQGKNMGTIKVQVASGGLSEKQVNPDRLRIQIASVFREIGVTDIVVQVEKDVVVGY